MATTEVAEALLAHAALQEATVYGVTVPGTPRPPPRPTAPPIHSRAPQSALSPPTPPEGHEGRAGMAAVVLRPGWALDGAELFRHVAAVLPPYAWPRFIRLQVKGHPAGRWGTPLWGRGGTAV